MKHVPVAASVLDLEGGALQRGAGQSRAAPASGAAVREAIELRCTMARAQLELPSTRSYLDAQWAFHSREAAECLDEMRGVARGFAIDERRLFAYLHLGVIADLDDGCTAWARSDRQHGAVLAKNRDFRGEHTSLQRIFRHRDPAWRGRRLLAVGSLGSPGVYSSGINSSGLALADTQVGTRDHGVGLLRYFLMTRILAHAASVDEALAIVNATAHAGGGTLVLADAGGALAAVELGHRRSAIERVDGGHLVRTNHFVDPGTAAQWRAPPGDRQAASSQLRRAAVLRAQQAAPGDLCVDAAFELMSRHDGADPLDGLCRHGGDGDALTISCAVFALSPPTLYFCDGTPCRGSRVRAAP
ncbi:MAG: hypothetical protein KJZ83_18330 [Burkholderiaceae bacterium]|nr:hypothetical protein [Burkholderiaceae bacterium]